MPQAPAGQPISDGVVLTQSLYVEALAVPTNAGLLPGIRFTFPPQQGDDVVVVLVLEDHEMERAAQQIKVVGKTAIDNVRRARRLNLIPTPIPEDQQ